MTSRSTERPGGSPPAKCRIAEILQYTCEVESGLDGRPQCHCFPIPRIFRICQGRPAVEITRLVNIDMATGEIVIDIPPETSLPKAKVWRDVIRHAQYPEGEEGSKRK